MLFVRELSPLILIRRVKPRIIDGERILLTEDALHNDQGSKEYNRSNNGNEFFIHATLTSFPINPFFHKTRANHTKNNYIVKGKMDLLSIQESKLTLQAFRLDDLAIGGDDQPLNPFHRLDETQSPFGAHDEDGGGQSIGAEGILC